MKYLLWYILGINLVSLFCYGVDKSLARKKMLRISESYLFLLSIIGGSLGALGGMFLFRHKTKKFKFYMVNIVFSIIWIYVILKLWK